MTPLKDDHLRDSQRLGPRDYSGTGRAPVRAGIQVYGVIRGLPKQTVVVAPSGDQPHYHILLNTVNHHAFDVSVDIHSSDNTDVFYHVFPSFTPPNAGEYLALPQGPTSIGSAGASGLGLDYTREKLVARSQLTDLRIDAGVVHDFKNDLTAMIQRAIASGTAEVFAFGMMYAAASNGKPNPVFHFSPDMGIHDIHRNQGNPTGPNTPYTDGGLLVHYPSDGHWEAAFFAFQDQTF